MDIKRINSDHSDALEQVKQLKANFLSVNSSAKADEDDTNKVTDTADSDAFSSLKAKVAQAKEAGRAEYISKLKESIASGEYNVNSAALADAMLADGVGEFLVS